MIQYIHQWKAKIPQNLKTCIPIRSNGSFRGRFLQRNVVVNSPPLLVFHTTCPDGMLTYGKSNLFSNWLQNFRKIQSGMALLKRFEMTHPIPSPGNGGPLFGFAASRANSHFRGGYLNIAI